MSYFLPSSFTRVYLIFIAFLIQFALLLLFRKFYADQNHVHLYLKSPQSIVTDRNGKVHLYDRNSPMIFIGGFPRSGTTLTRVILDAHPDVRCGEETRILVRLLLQTPWIFPQYPKETRQMKAAGITDQLMKDALAAFILEIMAKHAEPSNRLCNKDPFTMQFAHLLGQTFPRSKFLFLIRDGRAVVHSIMSRNIKISGFNNSDYRDSLKQWNENVEGMLTQCEKVGPERCLQVKYETLVLEKRKTLEAILNFLELPWTENVMHHETFFNKSIDLKGTGRKISLSELERSTDQVIKPFYEDALTKWVKTIPKELKMVTELEKMAPVLSKLGYDVENYPPNYHNL